MVHESPHSRISNLFELDEELFWGILSDPSLHSILCKIFPDGYHCTTFSSNNLRKGDEDKRNWHCDYPYHNMQSPYPEETLGVQVIWTLDDFTIENGATYYVPGSHTERRWPEIEQIKSFSRLEIERGHIAIFLGKLWHSQGINTTDNPRAALLANFSPLYVPAKDDIASQIEKHLTNGRVEF